MLWLKGCPRCRGDLYEERDQYGYVVACFQCGHELTQAEMAMCKQRAQGESRRKEPVAA